MNRVILAVKNLVKRYPGVIALNDVSIDFYEGEVHALLGENGAGKSTLIKIIAGAVLADEGYVEIDGRKIEKMEPVVAKRHGVEVIYQEFNLMGTITVAENISLGIRDGKLVDFKKMAERANAVFDELGVEIDPMLKVNQLSTSQQQLVEIAKAVSKDAKIIIMDEPSAPLSVAEVKKLFEIIKKLQKKGVTIIYISHRLDEIMEISNRVSIMRDGHYIETRPTSEVSTKELVQLMVGRELSETYPVKKDVIGEPVLEVRGLSGDRNESTSFILHRGEILGVAGLVGAGRTELARLIYGADKKRGGEVLVHGKPVKISLPSDAIQHGIGLIPEDRKVEGCFLEKPIDWNVTISSVKKISTNHIVDRKKEKALAKKFIDLFAIKTPSVSQITKNLSGGNQQKVVLAKTLASNSEIIIFDEPTRGIDVGAKHEIYELMVRLAEEGKAILMITSDMPELLGMSDRIIVLAQGALVGELERTEFSQVKVLELASNIYKSRSYADGSN